MPFQKILDICNCFLVTYAIYLVVSLIMFRRMFLEEYKVVLCIMLTNTLSIYIFLARMFHSYGCFIFKFMFSKFLQYVYLIYVTFWLYFHSPYRIAIYCDSNNGEVGKYDFAYHANLSFVFCLLCDTWSFYSCRIVTLPSPPQRMLYYSENVLCVHTYKCPF